MDIKNLKVNDKVKIKYFKKRPNHWNSKGRMDKWQGKEVTIEKISYEEIYVFENDWQWYSDDFETIVEFNNQNQYLLCKK